MGMDASNTRSLANISLENIDNQINVKVYYTFTDLAQENIVYTFAEDDNIIVNLEFNPLKDSIPDIPRIGFNFKLTKEFDSVEWFGRGPFENYEDRKTSAFIDLYKSSIDDLYFPYVRPQENGNRTDVRWLSLINNNIGLLIDGIPTFSFSALPFTIADLDLMQEPVYMHINELKKRDFIDVNIDYKQQGVGGDDSWYTPVHPEYRIKPDAVKFSFRLKPYDVTKENNLTLSK
jgi:beta-galactosidase